MTAITGSFVTAVVFSRSDCLDFIDSDAGSSSLFTLNEGQSSSIAHLCEWQNQSLYKVRQRMIQTKLINSDRVMINVCIYVCM